MPELLERRRKDLEDQFDVLVDELSHWKALSAEHEPFEKHHSQIDALSQQMIALNEKVKNEWGGSNDFVAIQKAQRDCGAVQTVWNYFREKLLMRSDAQLGTYLRAADAYVWACYEPVLRQWRKGKQDPPLREPPLVAFNTELAVGPVEAGQRTPLGDTSGATAELALRRHAGQHADRRPRHPVVRWICCPTSRCSRMRRGTSSNRTSSWPIASSGSSPPR